MLGSHLGNYKHFHRGAPTRYLQQRSVQIHSNRFFFLSLRFTTRQRTLPCFPFLSSIMTLKKQTSYTTFACGASLLISVSEHADHFLFWFQACAESIEKNYQKVSRKIAHSVYQGSFDPHLLVLLAYTLAVADCFPEELIREIFSIDFLGKLDAQLESMCAACSQKRFEHLFHVHNVRLL